jgi:hypothetical protein
MSSPKLTHKKVVGIKTEATQGTLETLASTDYILAEDVSIKPIPDMIIRDPKRATLDPLAHVMGMKYVQVSLKTEVKNGGSPGVVYAPLDAALQACGFVPTTHSGSEAIGSAVASSANLGVSPNPVIAIGTPTFSSISGKLILRLQSKVVTGGSEAATFQGEFVPGDGSASIFDTVTINHSGHTAVAFASALGAFTLSTDDPSGGGAGLPVTNWHVGDSWSFVYTSASEVDVTYLPTSAPASSNYFGPGKSATILLFMDGVKHIITGALGTFKVTTAAGKLGYWDFTFTGTYAAPSDVAFPSTSLVTQKPAILESAGFQIQGFSGIIDNFEYDVANDVQPRPDANSVNSLLGFIIVNRKPVGSCDPEVATVANHAFWDRLMSGTEGALQITQGNVSGNKVKFSFPKAQYSDATYEDRKGLMAYKIPLQFNQDSGDDHAAITLF